MRRSYIQKGVDYLREGENGRSGQATGQEKVSEFDACLNVVVDSSSH